MRSTLEQSTSAWATNPFTSVRAQAATPKLYVLPSNLPQHECNTYIQFPGKNNITLGGRLVPQYGTQNLSEISQLFTNYINGDNSPVIASGLSTVQNDGTEISWLTIALQALRLTVPFKPLAPLNPIRTINIDELGLGFTPDTAWTPSAESNSVHASLELPFGFSLSISEIENDFNISANNSVIAGLSTVSDALTCLKFVTHLPYFIAHRRFNLRDSNHQFDKHSGSNQYLHSQYQLELPIGEPPRLLVI